MGCLQGMEKEMKKFRDFESAREFARKLKLKSQKEWYDYCKSGNKPDDIPQDVGNKYKNNGWNGFGDFLGNGNVATRTAVYLSFNECRKFVLNLDILSQMKWQEYCASGNKPNNIPATPWVVYKKEWQGMGDFFGTGRSRNFRPFQEAKKFASSLGLKNRAEWMKYCTSGNKPDDIPRSPRDVYKEEFIGWGYFLGTGNIKSSDRQYRSYNEAKKFASSLGLKNRTEWDQYCVSGNKPDDIPSTPWTVYKEWKKK